MKRSITVIGICALALFAAAFPASAGQSNGTSDDESALEATDIGVSPDEIRVAVIADVETPSAPGLFQGSADGVRAWAEWVNDNGGLAGREVVVDFIDSHVSADDARNAIIEACANDFALVGTSALFVNNIDDLVGCQDSSGAATGLPDFPVVVTEPIHQCSPVSFPVNPPTLVCDTMNEVPQTYRANTGPTRYYLKHFGDLEGVFVYPGDLRAGKNATVPIFLGQQKLGIEQLAEFDMSGLAPQSQWGPVVHAIKDTGANYARTGLAFNSTIYLRREAKLQGANDVKVWDCSLQCYDRRLIEQGGADVEGQFVYTSFLPFEETKSNKMLRAFTRYVEDPDGWAMQAWIAGLMFQAAVDQVVAADGPNGLTRAAVLDAAADIEEFDADGLIGPMNIAERSSEPCFVLLQVEGGKFVRVFPKKPGTFDCNPKNQVETKLDLLSS